MYHEFYGLNRMPFQGSPDPDFLFPGPTHREALATLEYGVEAGMGFILLTGEVGLGKTTLIRTFLNRAERPDLFVIYVFHPLLSFEELLAVMAEELELELGERESYHLMRSIQRNLIARFEAGQRVVLIIDEAHRLPEETIENLRLISNLETDDAKLLQIVIVGQPELEALLAQPRLRQLDQRITLRARLKPLSRAESEAYIRHRLQHAGALAAEDAIAPEAIREIARRAGGVPRRINNLATLALIHGFGAGERPIRTRRVRSAAAAPGDNALSAAAPAWSVRRRAVGWVALAAGALAAGAIATLDDGAARAWVARQLDRAAAEWRMIKPPEPAPTRTSQAPEPPQAIPPPPEPAPAPAPTEAAAAPPARVVEPVVRSEPTPTQAAVAVPVSAPLARAPRDDVPAPMPQKVVASEPAPAAPAPPRLAAIAPLQPANPQLRDAQLALGRLGYDPGPIDGIFGPLTARALVAFQRDRTLTETGTLTPETAQRLDLGN